MRKCFKILSGTLYILTAQQKVLLFCGAIATRKNSSLVSPILDERGCNCKNAKVFCPRTQFPPQPLIFKPISQCGGAYREEGGRLGSSVAICRRRSRRCRMRCGRRRRRSRPLLVDSRHHHALPVGDDGDRAICSKKRASSHSGRKPFKLINKQRRGNMNNLLCYKLQKQANR